MTFTIKQDSNQDSSSCEIVADSDMSIYSASKIHDSLTELIGKYESIDVDLSSVEEIDCSGIQLLLAFTNSVRSKSGQVRLTAASQSVVDVIDILNIEDQFTWKNTH